MDLDVDGMIRHDELLVTDSALVTWLAGCGVYAGPAVQISLESEDFGIRPVLVVDEVAVADDRFGTLSNHRSEAAHAETGLHAEHAVFEIHRGPQFSR